MVAKAAGGADVADTAAEGSNCDRTPHRPPHTWHGLPAVAGLPGHARRRLRGSPCAGRSSVSFPYGLRADVRCIGHGIWGRSVIADT